MRDGVAYPPLWTLLAKAGSSNAPERIGLMERFLTLFWSGAVRFIAMDSARLYPILKWRRGE